jgi:hypothetical protein
MELFCCICFLIEVKKSFSFQELTHTPLGYFLIILSKSLLESVIAKIFVFEKTKFGSFEGKDPAEDPGD